MSRRPNILFAFADDWGRYASVYRGMPGASPLNELITTPTVDRVAREGVLFSNALVPAPTCTPCRSSVLSGRYFWQTRLGAILQGAVWDDAIPSYPRMLAQAGTFRLGFDKRPREELYDLRRDPHHMRNLADDPAHAGELRRLRDLLMAELRAQRDPRVCEADCRFEHAPYTDVVQQEHLMNRQEAADRLARAGT